MNLRAVCLTALVIAYAVGVSALASGVVHFWKGPIANALSIGGHDAAVILGPALWLALAGCPFPVRLVVQLVWHAGTLAANVLWVDAVYTPGTVGAVNWELQWRYVATIWIVAALLAPLRYWAGAIRREPLDPQLTLKGLFGLTLAIAIALALSRSAGPLVLEWAQVPAGICTVISVVLLTVGTSPRRKSIAAFLAVAVALLWAWMCYSSSFPRAWIVAVPAVEALVLAFPLLVCRRLGYRLQR
jgi:hypothetical protein